MELDKTVKDKLAEDNIEISFRKKQQQEYKLVGQRRLIPGLTMYEFDYMQLTLKKAEIKVTKNIDWNTGKRADNKKIMYNQNAIYLQAHCDRTAVRKANMIILQVEGVKDYFKIDNKKNIISQKNMP